VTQENGQSLNLTNRIRGNLTMVC